jgi:outer membrane autotransporter protein
MSRSRLVDLSGSTIRAVQIAVRSGATFWSAGLVIGNIAVAGTLSPGASPGTMTVTGNVSLASGSVSLFEITPTIADKLVIDGGLSIASGATLRIVADGAIRPGTSYDLIVASGGISGSYTTIDKTASLFGFVVQRADRIQLLSQFLGDPAFSPQITRSVAYANAAIQVQPATSTLFAALPSLLTASGASNPLAFAQLTPEAYASATQMGVDQTLSLTDVARGPGFATTDREDVGVFTFAQGIAQWHTLGADRDEGTAKARTSGYGFLGGIGIGNRDWSVGAFAGYLDSRQRIASLGAATSTDGVVAGVHGRYAASNIRIGASILYDGSDARTTRALPGASSATGRYGLHNWVSDVSVGYALAMANDWTLTPKVGVTYVRTTRDRVSEAGGPFALTVARNRHVTGFTDAGVTFARSETSDAVFRPYIGFGARTRINGKRADAIAGYVGAPLTLTALGAPRAQLAGTASAGVAYCLPTGVELFSTVEAQTGRDDHRESISTGARLRF